MWKRRVTKGRMDDARQSGSVAGGQSRSGFLGLKPQAIHGGPTNVVVAVVAVVVVVVVHQFCIPTQSSSLGGKKMDDDIARVGCGHTASPMAMNRTPLT